MSVDPVSAIAALNAWREANIETLSAGSNNKVYLVTQGSRRGVLKIDEVVRERPFNSRREEAAVQTIAADAGLAAAVIAVDDTMIFCEFIDGTSWQRPCLGKEGNLERVAHALKKLHGLPLTGRSFDASVAARRYIEKNQNLDTAIAARCEAIITSMRLPQNLCFCHNDLVAENMIENPELRFLDWEYACDNDPFFDLATVVEHHELSDFEASRLLDAYFDGDGERWRESLEKQRRLYLALLCLWMASRPDCDAAQMNDVVQRLLTSCS